MQLRPEEIEAILHMEDLIKRNLHVTAGYYRLSEGMRQVVGAENGSWCTFATHASNSVGYSIRHEIRPEELERVFRSFRYYRRMLSVLRRYLTNPAESEAELALINQILLRISLKLSEGNIKVFAELAFPFSQMVATFAGDAKYDEAKLAQFLSQFTPGATEEDGQDALAEAFAAYYQAQFEADPKRKAQLIFLGNLLTGLHEQKRLQPVIYDAIHAPVDEVLGDPLPLYITPLGKWINGWVHKAFLGISRRVFSNIVTQLFMSIYLPSGELKLGLDVRPPTRGQEYPPALEDIELERLSVILEQVDRTRNTLFGSRAANWSDLDDRMNFIVDFFRSYQQYDPLFYPPYTSQQITAIEAGHVPEGI